MKNTAVSVDFTCDAGEMKPLHGVNNSPLSLYEPPKGFREAGIPFCRLHDTGGAFGGTRYVDIPNVFPDFNADPADPRAYDFAFTDAYLKQLHSSGTEIFYRLGVTIENNFRIKSYRNRPPRDFAKWADICAGIVRHYNAGWADGFHFGIRYWEIWNEPENPPMWSGTRKEYFELYRITARRLKAEFPELLVGGYGGCGFYAATRSGMSDFYQSFLTWFTDFLQYVTSPRTSAPLDFFSWHLYTADAEEIRQHAEFVDTQLKKYRLTRTQSIFNEWNYLDPDPAPEVRWVKMKESAGASFVAAAFCVLQNSPVASAMYYDAYPQRTYCGLYYFPAMTFTPAYYTFAAYNALYELKKQKAVTATPPGVYALAAGDGADAALLLANPGAGAQPVCLELNGAPEFTVCRITDRGRTFADVPFPADGKFELPAESVLLLSTRPVLAAVRSDAVDASRVHAGLDGGGQ